MVTIKKTTIPSIKKSTLMSLYEIEDKVRELAKDYDRNTWEYVYLYDLLKVTHIATNHFALRKVYERSESSSKTM